MDDHPNARQLLTGEPCVHPDEFLRGTGLTREEMAALLAAGLLVGGYDGSGALRVIFLDPLPSTGQLRALGMTPAADWILNPRAASTEVEDLDDGDEAG